jgi:hypothetical protein
MIGLLSQSKWKPVKEECNTTKLKFIVVRIAGAALVLATSLPDKSVLIAESALQSVGLSPLLFEVSLVMLRWYDQQAPRNPRPSVPPNTS